jgi:hypothetical protein
MSVFIGTLLDDGPPFSTNAAAGFERTGRASKKNHGERGGAIGKDRSLACLAAFRKTCQSGQVAQLVEHTTENRGVAGSIPALATSLRFTPFSIRLDRSLRFD